MGIFDGPSWSDKMLREAEDQADAARKSQDIARRRARENAAANDRLIKESKKRTELIAQQTRAAQEREQQQLRAATQAQQAAARAQQAAARAQQAASQRQEQQQTAANWALFRQTPEGVQWQGLIETLDRRLNALLELRAEWLPLFEQARQDCAARLLTPAAPLGYFVPADHAFYTEGKGVRRWALMKAVRSFTKTNTFQLQYQQAQKDLEKRNPEWAKTNAACANWVSETSRTEIGVDFVNDTQTAVAPFSTGGIAGVDRFEKEWAAYRPRIIREMPAYDPARLQLTIVPQLLPPETYTHPALSEFLIKAAARL